MSKVIAKGLSRFFATMLVVVMVFSLLPLNSIVVFAATAEHTEAVTITVIDDNGDPLSGVTVSYHIDSELNETDYKTGSVVTDEYGCVEVLAKDDFVADDLTLSATASLTDYTYAEGSGAITNVAITSDDQDFSIQMKATKITGITVIATAVTYDGEDHDAATVSGTKQGDVITFKLGENPEQSEMPTIKEPDNYTLFVKVQREGFDDFVTTVYPSVEKATIELNVQEYSAAFDNNEHPALTVSGLLATDTVTYSLNGGEASAEIPTIINVGDYSVAVHVERHGYNDLDHTYNNIHIVATSIEGLSAASYQGTYDGQSHDAVTVSGTDEGDLIEYKLGEDGTWAEDVPQIKDAGNYTVFVRVSRTNYEITNVDVLPANAYIAKANQTLAFNNFTGTGSEIELTGTLPSSQEYDFSATDSEHLVEGSSISYSLELSEEDEYESEEAIAEIDATSGLLKVYYPGTIVVKATLSGDDNYNDCTIHYELMVTGKIASNGQYISFDSSTIEYVIGAYNGIASTQKAIKANNRIRGTITYSIPTTAGLQIDSTSGKITISDYTALADAIRNADGTLTVVVTANKAASMSYSADTATYVLSVKFADIPADPYSIAGTIGSADNWYNSVVTATPAAGYLISKTEPVNFDSMVSFDDQGECTRYVYLQNASEGENNGEITDRIAVNVKIDTVAPSTNTMKITYSTAVREEVLSLITFGYYNPTVTVTFEAVDETSGLSHLNWTYSRQVGASVANLDQESGELTFDDKGKAYLTLTSEEAKQYRGNLSFTATDNAGNTSDEKTDTGHVVVVDTIAPTCFISYTDPLNDIISGEKYKRFFDGDVILTITVTENNFYTEDFVLNVSKDGAKAETVSPTWNPAEDADNVFIGTYTLTGDGDYIVYAEYKDRSNNSGTINGVASYESDILTIDTTDPQVSFTFDEEDQTITVTVVEHNFRSEDITAAVTARDRNNVPVDAYDLTDELQNAEWIQDGDAYSYTTENFVNGIYTVRLDYTDLANHSTSFTGDDFVIDHGEPSDPTITYSTSLKDTVVGVITLGFYNPDVTIRFTAYDEYSGIDHFIWSYARKEGASETNVAAYGAESIEAAQDASDSTKFTATITLPKNEADQLCGSISVTSYDGYGQSSNTVTDTGRVIVVDTIAPTMTVAYSEASNTVDGVSYYGLDKEGQAKVTFTVTEANFFAEDVVVKLSKGGTDTDISGDVVWNDNSVDVHVGTYTITDEGDYFVKVEYKDRSNNEMASYTSNQITIDTTKAVLDFAYDKATQKTTFTVTEHYFRASDISVVTVAKDITNATVAANDLDAILKGAEWVKDGDTYTFEYDGYVDAYYDLTISYTDIAKNVSDNCTPETFIIDHTKPTTPTIAYSTPLNEIGLGAVTLGFYNPTVEITFTAYDQTAGIDYFTWEYTREDNVSETNVASYAPVTVAAIQDSVDTSKFTATITLPKETADQLRGYISVSATDPYSNTSNRTDDSGKIVVVDTVSPTMEVAYSEYSNLVGTTMYYGSDKNGQVEVTLTVTEANFFNEDVIVKVAKNEGEAERVSPEWDDVNADTHIGKFTISGDGHYIVTVDYTDRSNKEMTSYTSEMITLDTVKPVIAVEYQNNSVINSLADGDGNQRDYFDKVQTAVVTITEHNFNADDVQFSIVAKDATGADLNVGSLTSRTAWNSDGDVHKITITCVGDANYTFDVDYTDLATNAADDYAPDYFTVDTVAPAVTSVAYSTSVLDTVLSSVSFGFYNAKMKVTITATDETAGVHKFDYSYLKAAGVSSVNAQELDQAIEEANIIYSNGRRTATMSFEIPKMVLGSDNQFNGTVKFDAIDRANNKVEQSEAKRIVVDNIAPTATITYNAPVNSVDGISYYDGNINGTITVNEANFYSDDVAVMVSVNGGATQVLPTTWSDTSVDVHVGQFTLTEDADYIVTVNYRDKSNNTMAEYVSNQLTIDTAIEAPVFTINNKPQEGDFGGAYNRAAEVAFNFEDQNFDCYTITLTRTMLADTVDVTGEFVEEEITEHGGTGTFTIPQIVENDGIYILRISIADKANHTAESYVRFSINRFGSTYDLTPVKDIINRYLQEEQDIVFTEINVNTLNRDSIRIRLIKNGTPVDLVDGQDYTIVEIYNDGKWSQYEYTINKELFADDGAYSIAIYSVDAAGNVNENIDEAKGAEIAFGIDKTNPVVIPVDFESGKQYAVEIKTVSVEIKDNLVLEAVKVLLNGEEIEYQVNGETYTFDIPEANSLQTASIIAVDAAGNETEVLVEGFLVSTNFFVRWFNNTPLFIGTVGGVGAVAIGATAFALARKRKKVAVK